MKQQINLFSRLPVVKVDKGQYTVKNLLRASVIISVLFTFYTIYINIEGHQLAAQIDQLTDEKKAAQKTYDDTSAQYPSEAKASIESQAKDVEQYIVVKKALLTLLQGSKLGTEGFSNKLETLSTAIQPGMWLTNIEFNLSEDYVGLSGISTNTDVVLKFVDKISEDPAFGGKKFATFRMDNPPDDSSILFAFVLSNSTTRQPPTPPIPGSATNEGASEDQNTSPEAKPENAPPAKAAPSLPAPNVNTLPAGNPAGSTSAVTMPNQSFPDDEENAKSNTNAPTSGGKADDDY